jgi:hypothetical protein
VAAEMFRGCRGQRQVISSPFPNVLLGSFFSSFRQFGWLVADGWCWFVLREEYCWLVCSERKVLLAGG